MSQETELVSMLLLTNDLELQTVMAKPATTSVDHYFVPSLNETHHVGTTIFPVHYDRSKIREIADEKFQWMDKRYKKVKKNLESI